MPILKPIKGSTKTVRNAIVYLVKVVSKPQVDRETGEVEVDELGNPVMVRASRALATDYINCTRPAADPDHLAVWEQMDRTRELWHNNEAANNGKLRTYNHYVLSPDPRDHVTLEQLRELTLAWVNKYFNSDSEEAAGVYECFIAYHDDNEGDREESPMGIMHAHVIVNNTDVCTGRRLSPKLTNEFNRRSWMDLQRMAAERGLHAFQRVDDLSSMGDEPLDHSSQMAQDLREYDERAMNAARDEGPSTRARRTENERAEHDRTTHERTDADAGGRDDNRASSYDGASSGRRARRRHHGPADDRATRTRAASVDSEEWKAADDRNPANADEPHVSGQRDYRTRGERGMLDRGAWSWKEDIRQRVRSAAQMATNEKEFVEECAVFGVRVERSKTRHNKGDFVYYHPLYGQPREDGKGNNSWRVTGARLGSDWTPNGVSLRLRADEREGFPKPSGKMRESLNNLFSTVTDLGAINVSYVGQASRSEHVSVSQVADMLRVSRRQCVASIADFDEAWREAGTQASRDEILAAKHVAQALHAYPDVREENERTRAEELAAVGRRRAQWNAPATDERGASPSSSSGVQQPEQPSRSQPEQAR